MVVPGTLFRVEFFPEQRSGIQAMTNKDILEWDVATWARALRFWGKKIADQNLEIQNGLELGAHHGGISLFFAKQYGANMVCSDLNPASEKAKSLHLQHGVSDQIVYAEIDATAIPYPNNTFDFVVFKSILGGIGHNNNPKDQQRTIAEIHRVLKPGGILFFAENLRGSVLHRLARRIFVPWGKSWRYLTINEFQVWLSIFETQEIRTTGFLAAFVPKPAWLRTLVSKMDATRFFLPPKWQYVAFGFARK